MPSGFQDNRHSFCQSVAQAGPWVVDAMLFLDFLNNIWSPYKAAIHLVFSCTLEILSAALNGHLLKFYMQYWQIFMRKQSRPCAPTPFHICNTRDTLQHRVCDTEKCIQQYQWQCSNINVLELVVGSGAFLLNITYLDRLTTCTLPGNSGILMGGEQATNVFKVGPENDSTLGWRWLYANISWMGA